MTFRIALLIACAGFLGLATPASASTATSGHNLQRAERAKMMNFAAATPKQKRGISVSTSNIDGDGTGDVVVATPPKLKHKPARRPHRHK